MLAFVVAAVLYKRKKTCNFLQKAMSTYAFTSGCSQQVKR
jgi:hypothetical protein